MTSPPLSLIIVLSLREKLLNVFQTVFNLYQWSSNFPHQSNPFQLYLDMIGWSYETLGENLTEEVDSSILGYKEIGLLAEALTDYSNHPQEVTEYVQFLMDCELEDIDVEDTSPEVMALCKKALEACYCVS